MATIRLIPSTYAVSSTQYLSVSNADRMYDNVDSTDYATITNTYASTSSRYLYLRGFNFDDIPSNAVVSSFTIKIKGYESGLSTGTSYAPRLANGTSALSNTTASINFGTSATTITIPTGSLDWQDIVTYGSSFTIMVYVRRASRNTTGYFYCYGAEIDVEYTIPNPRTLSVSLTGNGTVSPSGTSTVYDGDEVEVTITPTTKTDTVIVTHNGTDVTSQLVAHGTGTTSTFTANDHTTSGIQSGSSYASYAEGHTAENPSTSGTSSNMYSSSGSTGYAAYSFDFSSIPSTAVIEEIEVRCYGHRENATIDSSHVSQCVLYQGNTAVSEEVDFPSTSNSMITVTPNQSITRSELDNITLRHYVGYYGGLVLGISFEVTYSTGSGLDHYTYTCIVDGNVTIAVVIGGSGTTITLHKKTNGSWVSQSTVVKVYKKISGSWVEQSNIASAIDSSTNYIIET